MLPLPSTMPTLHRNKLKPTLQVIGIMVVVFIVGMLAYVYTPHTTENLYVRISIGLDIIAIILLTHYPLKYFTADTSFPFKEKQNYSWGQLAGNIAIMYIGLLIVNTIMTLVFKADPQNQQILMEFFDKTKLSYFLVYVVITGPILEELVFRRFVIGYLFEGSKLGVIISSLLFGALHLVNERTLASFFSGLFIYTSMGLVLGFGYRHYRSIKINIVVHMLINGFAVLAMFLLTHRNFD